ncbi:MAG: anaerobic sulfatase maturase [Clostridia bacterium]|nr:anaerobic sulfatase maturase [Clostridia bacterium]
MPPLSILIKPASGMCQYRCRYCFYQDVMNNREVKNAGLMTRDTLEALVKRAFQYAEGAATFAFQGGEPTLAGLSFFKELISLQKKHNVKGLKVFNSIQTNGGLIDDDWAEFFYENDFLIGLSIDGDRDTHDKYRLNAEGKGTYEHTRRAAEILRKHNAQFNILCVVNDDIAVRPKETYNALKKYGYLQFIPCIDDFGSEERMFSPTAENYGRFLIETFDLYKKDYESGSYVSIRTFDNYVQMLMGRRPESCSMSGRCSCYFVIEGNGDVYPCDFYVLDKWRLGNIKEDSFLSMSKTKAAKEFVSSSVYVNEDCRKCAYYALCRGGCRRDREPFDECDRPGKNRYCKSFRMFFSERKEALVEIARKVSGR